MLCLEQIYQDVIFDYYKYLQYWGLWELFGVQVYYVNLICGDEVMLWVVLFEDGIRVIDVFYDG